MKKYLKKKKLNLAGLRFYKNFKSLILTGFLSFVIILISFILPPTTNYLAKSFISKKKLKIILALHLTVKLKKILIKNLQ